jgi:hypothetical protein
MFFLTNNIDDESLFNSPIITQLLRGIKSLESTRPRITRKRQPVTTDVLEKGFKEIRHKLSVQHPTTLATWAVIVLGVKGLFRLGELVGPTGIRSSDISLECSPKGIRYVRIFLRKSKTDVYAEGNTIKITALDSKGQGLGTDNRLCPFWLTQTLLHIKNKGKPQNNDISPFFTTRKGRRLEKRHVISCMQQWFKNSLLPGQQFNGHSLRKGGATDLCLSGVQPDVIRQMGRWKSDAYKLYVNPDTTHLLDVQLQTQKKAAPQATD